METKLQTQNELEVESSSDLKHILDYFLDWEKQQPTATFLRQPQGNTWLELSWAEVGQQARRMAAALQSLGLQPGDKVGIVSKNCYHWIIADLAIMMGGYVSAPFYPTLTGPQLREVMDISEARVLFVGKLDEWENMRQGLPEHVKIIRFPHYEGNARVKEGLDWEELLAAHEPVEPRLPDLQDLWTILFTSGTTGTPKGVMLSYQAPAALLENERKHNNLKVFAGKEHRYFSYLPLNHIAERIIVEGAAIFTGGSISFAESLESFAKNLRDTRPTLFMAVPRIWTKFHLGILERLPQKRLDTLLRIPLISGLIKRKIRQGLGLDQARIMLTGAAPTPDSLKEWYLRLGLPLQEVYAMTENCGGCTLMPIEDIRSGTVGRALPNVELRIEPETGEVLMRAPWMMSGYYRDEEKTAQILRDGWLHTGDQGEIDPHGHLRITGRVSDTFKSSKGKFVVPAPIEWGFARNHFIEQVAVVGLAIPQPLAMVVLSEIGKQAPREEVSRSLEQTLAEVNTQLANYERVQAVVVVAEDWNVGNGILTPTMKIRRNMLDQRYQPQFQTWTEMGNPVIWEQ